MTIRGKSKGHFGGWSHTPGTGWTQERWEKFWQENPLTPDPPLHKRVLKRSGRPAYIAFDHEGKPNLNFNILQGPFVEVNGGPMPGSQFIPPPLPFDFQDANCFGVGPEEGDRFFPVDSLGTDAARRTSSEARDGLWKDYCSDCPVKQKCFEWGMAYEEWGIWAGATEFDRQRVRVEAKKNKKHKSEYLQFGRDRLAAGYQPYKEKFMEGWPVQDGEEDGG